ncbi:hypothetical protein K7X08_022080 [Anisodus acutangulus]|uniref:Uncharacterized protein n=1 Tax=Anisodus acutangulus TaxID=402998 RepID=A0A9Q1QUY5_9SOLA|nr:hypothetical protein K7X08_022080 [Anisodus acutangulus]
MAEEWANSHGGKLPSTREEKKQFKDLIKSKMITMDDENYKEAMEASFKLFSPQGIVGPNLQKIIDDSCTEVDSNSSDFWVMVAALKVCRYWLVEDEFNSPVQPELQKYLTDEEHGTLQEANSLKVLPENTAVGLYILVRAADLFAANYNKFPGQFDGEMDEDISRLKTTAVGLLNDHGCNGSLQLITRQFIPILWIYRSNFQMSSSGACEKESCRISLISRKLKISARPEFEPVADQNDSSRNRYMAAI